MKEREAGASNRRCISGGRDGRCSGIDEGVGEAADFVDKRADRKGEVREPADKLGRMEEVEYY